MHIEISRMPPENEPYGISGNREERNRDGGKIAEILRAGLDGRGTKVVKNGVVKFPNWEPKQRYHKLLTTEVTEESAQQY